MRRRKAIIGMGTLAMGSGAVFTSASFSNTTASDSAMEVYAAGNLRVRGGSSPSGLDYTTDYTGSINNASDLPAAYVSGDTRNGDLNVKVATRNSSSTKSFEYLLKVSNDSTRIASIGVGFDAFGTEVTGGPVAQGDVVDTYKFKTNDSKSSYDFTSYSGVSDATDISGTSGSPESPSNYAEVPSGETLAIDLSVEPAGSLVSDINSTTEGGPKFDAGDGLLLVDSITFGTETQNP